ncbi:thioesterase II family protein [Streptomyces abyssomicinicus]|uniref:thioesterase II family protein n=1 Tax=Streptomyces abyssomicinicus TaxID=574929 RepID=UPI00124FEEAA|nr:alpha/beta fold hydrolase [Streptomyces abyssomicinicus]
MTERPRRTAWIRRFHTAAQDAPHVVLFPHGGAGATSFHPLSRALKPQVQALVVQYPGRQDRIAEPCVADVGELADRVAEELEPWSGLPLVLFGHSLGSAVAFETAVRLERRGTTVRALFASARRAPSLALEGAPPSLDTDAELLGILKQLGGDSATPIPDDPAFLELVLPAVRNDFHASNHYRAPAGLRLTCPVTGLAGEEDPAVAVSEVEAWAGHTTGPFRLLTFPGGHFYLDDRLERIREEITLAAGRAAC